MLAPNSRYWHLFLHFTERDLKSRFAGSAFGMLWSLISPLLLLAIYSFIFGQILQQRATGLGTSSYTLFVAVALWPWMMFADGVLRGMQSIHANASLVRKVAFPHILLVMSSVTAAFATHLIGYVLVLAMLSAFDTPITLMGAGLALYYLALTFIITLGIATLLAALQTLLRDVEQIVTPILMMLQYVTPVLYPLTMIPESYRGWLTWNPLGTVVQRLRDALLSGDSFHAGDFHLLVLAIMALLLGLWLFRRLSPSFEDFV